MINKHDLMIIGITLTFSVAMIVIYDMTRPKPKEIVTVDIVTITDEFMRLATKSQLNEAQSNELIEEFASSLEEGLFGLSNGKVILAKRAVISEEEDLTNDLRNFIAGRLTNKGAQ